MAWRPPQLPKVQKLPPPRQKKASYGGRLVAGIAGLALLISGAIGVWGALRDKTGSSSPFMALAVLLPAVILIRYAFTGVIKAN